MRLCQSVRYAFAILAICFLLNGVSLAEKNVREQYKSATEPEGKAIEVRLETIFSNNFIPALNLNRL